MRHRGWTEPRVVSVDWREGGPHREQNPEEKNGNVAGGFFGGFRRGDGVGGKMRRASLLTRGSEATSASLKQKWVRKVKRIQQRQILLARQRTELKHE
eukprot:866997-Pleurochrysis_carterae.AAC.3